MKKKVMLIVMSILVIMLTFVFVGCNKDKTDEEPTTTEKASTTESTTFVAPEIKEDETTELTTEETTTEVTASTTKKTVSTNSGSSSGSSGSSDSSNKKPVSTTKASSSSGGTFNGNNVTVDENGNTFISNGQGTGGIMIPSNFEDLGSDEIVIKGDASECTTDEGADKAKLE